jgi:hypothetical protein
MYLGVFCHHNHFFYCYPLFQKTYTNHNHNMSGIIEKLKHPSPLPAVLTVGKSNRSEAVENLNALQVSEEAAQLPENSMQASEDETKISKNEAQESDIEKTPQLGPTHPSSPGVLSEFPPFEYTAPLDPA